MNSLQNNLPPGIHPGLGMREYHAWRLDKSKLIEGPISASTLCDFMPNPYAWVRTEKAVTKAMSTGSLFDLALTDDGALEASVAIMEFDDFKTKAARQWRDEQQELGKIIVSEDELEHARKAAAAVRSHHVAGAVVEGCDFQTAVVGSIEGIPAKCLIDILPASGTEWEETIFDYKTSALGIDDDSIRRVMGKLKYHWRGGFYRTLFNKVSKDRHCEDFAFIFQDQTTLEVRCVKLNPDDLGLGTRMIKAAVAEFIRCAEKGIGSRYARTVDELGVMPYASIAESEWLDAIDGKEAA